ncbi:MAG: hypothetical protein WAK21_06300, partial [Candidatus Sulfotelmatobacter sp.]
WLDKCLTHEYRAAVRGGFSIGCKVFNTTVDNPVEKRGAIIVSNSARDGSAFCTGASAGTLVW